MTLYFTGRRTSKAALFSRYDELSSETRTAIADFADAIAQLGGPGAEAVEALQSFSTSADKNPEKLLAALDRWGRAVDVANSKGLVTQMMCPEDGLSELISRVRGALLGDDDHPDYPGEVWVLVNSMIAKGGGPEPQLADRIGHTFTLRLQVPRAEMNTVIEHARERLNDPASTQTWVAQRIDDRSTRLWARVRVWMRTTFKTADSLPPVSTGGASIDQVDQRALGFMPPPLTGRELQEYFEAVRGLPDPPHR